MGRGIVYCGDCGKRLQESDFEHGRASEIDYVPYCADCRPPEAPPERKKSSSSGHVKIPSGKWIAPKKRSSSRALPIVPEDTPPPATRRRLVQSGGSKKPFLISGVVIGAAFLILLIALVSGGGGGEDRGSGVEAPPPAMPAPPPATTRRTDSARSAAPAPRAPADPAAAKRIFDRLAALASRSRNPEEILFECDKAKAALRGTSYFARIAEIEQKALNRKRERDMTRRIETSIADVTKMIDEDRAFKREGEVLRLLTSLIGMTEGAKKQRLEALLKGYHERRVLGRIEEAGRIQAEDGTFDNEEAVFGLLEDAVAVGGPLRPKAEAAIEAYERHRIDGRLKLAREIRAGDPNFEREEEVRGWFEEAIEIKGGSAPEIRKELSAYLAALNEMLRKRRTGPFDLDEEGYIRNWLVIGPFPNGNHEGLEKDYLSSEANAAPADRIEVKPAGAAARKWKAFPRSGRKFNFKHVGGGDWTVCYAAAWVESDSAQDVEIRLGSDDAFKLWLGGRLIDGKDVHRACAPDMDRYPVKLAKGRQLLLFKVGNGGGDFEGMLRIVTPGGSKATGIRIYN